MEIHIAGVVHNDPLGPERLKSWLRGLPERSANPPDFIAVEYASTDFLKIRDQRDASTEIAGRIWPEAPQALVDALAPSIAYEADAHQEIFPDLEVLWLDEFREDRPPGAVEHFAGDRLEDYCKWLEGEDVSLPIPVLLRKLSRKAWSTASDKGPEPRDEEFARLIKERVNQRGSKCAIVVVGANHARKRKGRMRERLESSGIPCTVDILDPTKESCLEQDKEP